MANEVNNISRSFADNVNYIAELDKQYYKSGYIKKNGIQLGSVEHYGNVTMNVFNKTLKVHSKLNIISGSIVGNNGLSIFLNNMKIAIQALYPDVVISISITDGTNSVVDKNLNITLSSTDTILGLITIDISTYVQPGVVSEYKKYSIVSSSDNFIAVLPYLSTLDDSFTNSVNTLSMMEQDIKNVNNNMTSLTGIVNDVIPNIASILNSNTSATIAATKASEASASATLASTSASEATTKATEASTSASEATTKATEAATKASEATTKATEASTSAAAALASKNAASTSETNALASKNAASTSETNALASKNAAATSATNAATSETNALASKNAAATSATSASTSATNAAASATASANSATNSATSATASATSATNSANSATAAAASAASAATSATNASNSATNSASSATSALASANTATTKSSEALTSANNASSSATSSAASASAAAASAASASAAAASAASAAAVVGNAATATKLATARTINGVLFDGSENITISTGTSGSYIPVIVNTGAVGTTALTFSETSAFYSQVGNVITVQGFFTVAVTGLGAINVDFTVSLPILPTSNFSSTNDVVGLAFGSLILSQAVANIDDKNGRMTSSTYISGDKISRIWFTMTYQILPQSDIPNNAITDENGVYILDENNNYIILGV